MKTKPILSFLAASCFFLQAGAVNSIPSATVESEDLDLLRKSFVEASIVTYAPDDEVTDEFIHFSDYGRANDVLLLQLYMSIHLPDSEVERLIEAFDSEKGCWRDIDYEAQDRGRWPATLHVTRLYSLAKIYKFPGNRWNGSKILHDILHSGMEYWFTTMPVCPNWWHNDIGVPKKMTAVLLMLRDEISEDEIQGGLKVLERSRFGMTGQNKVWLAGNNLMKGLLIDDEALVRQATEYISEEICVTDSEGIQEDWSFHQHGPQLQFGNYGLAFADGISFWFRVLAGTDYMFPDEKVEIFSNFMKEGLCQSVFKGVMDPSCCGRQNFIDAGRGKACALAVTARNMAVAMEKQAAAGKSSRAEEMAETSDFYAAVAEENLMPADYANSVVGAKYYSRSDFGIYRQPHWYGSVRMHSERTIGFEFTNRENTLANFSADGAVILMQDGEEFENIFACWDWRKVPGVTAYDNGKPIKCDDSRQAKRNWSGHVAGAVQGDVMAASMELERDGLHALKTTFFFEDCIIALGSDIRASDSSFNSVTTAVDQTLLSGEITCDKSAVSLSSGFSENVRWVHHNDRGYVSLDGSKMCVSSAVQKGKWDDIDPAFTDKYDEKPVFKCWFEHPVEALKDGGTASYSYAVIPCSTAKEVAAIGKMAAKGDKKNPYKVLSNTSECQAVLYNGVLCAAIHKAGSYILGSDILINAESPCIMIRSIEGVTIEKFPESIGDIAAVPVNLYR